MPKKAEGDDTLAVVDPLIDPKNPSVTLMVPTMQKYIIEIARSEQKGAPDPVFLSNGDYKVTLKRGIRVICPEALKTVLDDAVTGVVDPITKEVRDVPSFPYSATLYNGPLKIGTVVDSRGNQVATVERQ